MRFVRGLILLIATVALPAWASAQTYPSKEDPRSKLKPGRLDAETAASNMRLVSFTPKPTEFDSVRGLTFVNSDMAFGTHFAYQANFAGFSIWDIADPAKPVLASVTVCITSQGDPTIVGHLLFISAEGAGNRNDCGKGGVQDPKDHMQGVRIFDVTNPKAPKLIKNVQTCKGSHTNTLVPSPKDPNIVYIYVSGGQAARPETELAGCKNGTDPADVTNSLFMLDIIKVPLDHPENAKVIPGARIFTGLDATPECVKFCLPPQAAGAGRGGRGGRGAPPAGAPGAPGAPDAPVGMPVRTGPRNCHDVTAYPAMNLLSASCGTHAILVDITNPEKPFRIDAITDENNFQGRHTAAFSNDAKKVIQTDEWGGGTGPMCQAGSMMELGGNTIISVDAQKKQKQHGYFKLPAAQSAEENCVSHNGGLIPVPGRDLYVQGWYQGGVDIMDFTDQDNAFEIAYFDRGSIDPPAGADIPTGAAAGQAAGRSRGTTGGSWGAYYWNGHIYSSELDRGFDIYELTPSAHLSANEIAAAKLVTMLQYNPQSQPKLTWPPAFVVVRSYLDQLVRGRGLAADRTTAIAAGLDAAEQKTGAPRAAALTALAKQVDDDATGAKDAARVKTMANEIRRLAAAK